MKLWWTLTAAVVLSLGALGTEARACPPEELVAGWYAKYYHRVPQPWEVNVWARQLRAGASAEQMESSFIGSEEYWCLHGSTPEGFVVGMYQDLLGRTPCAPEVEAWACKLPRLGTRDRVASRFLYATQVELSQRAATTQAYAPQAPTYSPPAYAPQAPPYSPPGYAPVDPITPQVGVRQSSYQPPPPVPALPTKLKRFVR